MSTRIVRFFDTSKKRYRTFIENEAGDLRTLSRRYGPSSQPLWAKRSEMPDQSYVSFIENREFECKPPDGIHLVSEVEEQDSWGSLYLQGRMLHSKGFRGQGIRIGIADTGLDTSHSCFRAMRLQKFVDIDRTTGETFEVAPFDSQWHGTFCTSLLCGSETNGFMRGLAIDSEIFVAKVFNKFNSSTAAVHSAFEFFIQNEVRVASISLGAPNFEPSWIDIINEFVDGGGVVIAGIGNDFGGDAPTISPGNYPIKGLLGVGAHDEDGIVWDDSGGGEVVLSEFSEFGLPDSVMKPDLLAPGAGMVAVGSKGKFKVGSGTSYATPLIAGLVSCLWSKNPEFDGSSILSLLFGLLSDAGSPGPDVRYGRGKIDPEKLSVILSDILS